MKRFLAALLIAITVFLCGCGADPQREAYPLKVNGTPLDGEVFTFFLDEAARALPDGTQEEQINYAVQLCIHYVAVNSAFTGAGLSLTPAEKKEVNDETGVQWNLYGSYYLSIGISRQTFAKLRLSERCEEKLRQAYFGEGGAYEVPRDQLKAYLENRYVSFRAIRIPKKILAADGSETDRDAAQQTALDEKLAAGLAALNGGTGIESVFATFVADRKGDREEYTEVVTDGTDHAYPAEFADAVRAMPVESAAVFDFGDDYYLVYRDDLRDDEDIFEAYKDECLAGLTDADLRRTIDNIARSYTSVTDQPVIAACWNNYKNATAKAGQS